ncbi:hypothetical protein G6F62_013649 [Rhizopus arrhizus]|nr:hypothetical protein G6F22_018173 [Rhizopus arrhizus]KAG1251234.1 hypothetical protein G6F68_012381 [Rhizopus microsporus]KAG1316204.1 hypothetical protein G6F62_013649 [Rhizopus arrhizus]
MQGQHGRAIDLVQQQGRQRAVTAVRLIGGRHVHGFQQQLPQQRRHLDHLAGAAIRARGAGLDVRAACADVQHAHLVRDARGYPHGALRGHHPVAVTGLHLHDAGGAVQQLRAPVGMGRQQLARRIVVADGDHGAVQRIVAVDMGIAHGGQRATRQAWPKYEHY